MVNIFKGTKFILIPKIVQINKSIIGKEFGIAPDSFLLVLILFCNC